MILLYFDLKNSNIHCFLAGRCNTICDEPIPFYDSASNKTRYQHKCCNGYHISTDSFFFTDKGECETIADKYRSYEVFYKTNIATLVFCLCGIIIESLLLLLFMNEKSIRTPYGILCMFQASVDICILVVIGAIETPLMILYDTR